jgi:hypothetical protein
MLLCGRRVVSLGLYGKGFILKKPLINLGIKVGLLHHEAPKTAIFALA